MSFLYQHKLEHFNSEMRRNDIERKINAKRYQVSKCDFLFQMKSFKNSEIKNHEYFELVTQQIEIAKKNQEFNILYPFIKTIRTNFIYHKNETILLKGIVEKLLELCLNTDFLKENDQLLYECSWIFINFIGLESSKISAEIKEKFLKIFIHQMTFPNNKQDQKEVIFFSIRFFLF